MAPTDYRERLAWLNTEVVLLAELVVDRYADALTAAATGDRWLAEEVVDGDAEINERYLELERHCTDLIALQQPVASDLRLITASFKIITDLERVGDLATNLAARTRAGQEGIHPAVDIETLGGDAAAMVEAAIEAYEAADPEACRTVAERDDDLDAACDGATRRIIRSLLAETDVDRAAARTAASRGFLTVRDIERVGDHAVNIAARSLYMIDGSDELLY